MLPSRVFVHAPANPEAEDIFSSSLASLFTDDIQNSHGTPGHSVIYKSPRYGNITLIIPRHPDVEEGRKLFAHYLWNSGVVAAEAIESASSDGLPTATSAPTGTTTVPEGKVSWKTKYWNVRGKSTLEVGAGTGLPSIIAALSNASSVTITDHPCSPSLTNDTIAQNVQTNLSKSRSPTPTPTSTTSTKMSIHGLLWGDPLFTSASTYGKPASPQPARHSFDRMIIADCLWMPSQHENLVRTIDLWLTVDPSQQGCALVVAGFHTGRDVVAQFFEVVMGWAEGGVEEGDAEGRAGFRVVEIFEVDVDCNVREWRADRGGETKEETKRWVVCAVLQRR